MACLGLFCADVYHTHPHLLEERRCFESLFLRSKEVQQLYDSFCQLQSVDDRTSAAKLFSFFDSLDYEDEIKGADVKKMIVDLYGKNYLLQHPKLAAVHKKLSSQNDVPFTLEHFKEFSQSHDLLTPAFYTQNQLRTILLGKPYWILAVDNRKKLENEYAFKRNFELENIAMETFIDLPRKPKPSQPSSSVQNHSRGNSSLTAAVKHSHNNGRRKSNSEKGEEDTGSIRSPGDHPSLRKRRSSWDEGQGNIDRTTKLSFQKNMDPTEHDMSLYKKDVLSVISQRPNSSSNKGKKASSNSRRRHSFGGNTRIAPVVEEDSAVDENDKMTGENGKKVGVSSKKSRKNNRRRSF